MIYRGFRIKQQAGATLIEVLVAIAITGLFLPVLATVLLAAQSGKTSTSLQLQATSLLHEGDEAVRSVRNTGWSGIATDGTYHPVISGSNWTLVNGSQTIGGFTRQVVISPAQRDGGGSLVSTGGNDDPSTKHIVVTVSWSTPNSASLSSDMDLSRWQHNAAWQQTTQADFTAGTLTGTTPTNTAGGEVSLSGSAPYSSGTFESSTFDAGNSVGFNAISWNASVPGDASVKFQIAASATDGSWVYVGPDGTGGSYFTAAGSIPFTSIVGRYFRYKVFLDPTSDSSQTPILQDVEVNYSL